MNRKGVSISHYFYGTSCVVRSLWFLTMCSLILCLRSPADEAIAAGEAKRVSEEPVPAVLPQVYKPQGTVSSLASKPYRFDEHLNDVVFSESGPVDAAVNSTVRVWPPKHSASEQYQSINGNVTVEEGLLRFTTEEGGGVILPEALGIYTPDVASIALELRVKGPSKLLLFWRYRSFPWVEEVQRADGSFCEFPVTADGAMHTYNVRLDNMDIWRNGRIVDGLQLVCDEAVTMDIARVEVRNRMEFFNTKGIGVRDYAVNGEIRQVLFMHTPARARYRIRLPEQGVFSAGMAAVQNDNPAAFTVNALVGDKKEILLSEDGIGPDTWKDQQIDLSVFAGSEVDIELAATSEKPGQVVLWSNPCVYKSNDTAVAQERPNILIYLVDALRADRLEIYGHNRKIAPGITELAENGTVFQHCFSQETCTKPSVMTLYTGVDSQAHGCTCNSGPQYKEELPFFSTSLRNSGYATAAITQNAYGPPLSATQNSFSRLVELFDINDSVTEDAYTAAVSFLEQHQDRPFYLYIHTMECHELWTPDPETFPYTLPPPLDEVWEDPERAYPPDRYDVSIAYADYNFRRVMDKLDELDLRNNTLVIFTSDHGFALGERGEWAHGKDPYLDQIHVPLIMHWPAGGMGPAVIEEQVQLADIGATLLELTGVGVPEVCQGTSLMPLLRGDNQQFLDRHIYAYNGWTQCASVTRGKWKLFKNKESRERLYSIEGGVPETEDVAAAHPEIAAALYQSLKAHMRKNSQVAERIQEQPESVNEVAIDPVKREILKSLGYLGD